MNIAKFLYYYWRAKRLHFRHAGQLHNHQQQQLKRFFTRTLSRSPYFSAWLDKPLAEFPLMDKHIMMTHFDRLNTAGLKRKDVLECAYQAENSRDFSPTLNGYSVGLSSGTTGKRGAFLVSPDEQTRWAAIILAKLLPKGLWHKECIAFFLRANNNLYNRVRSPIIQFEFFDLFIEFDDLCRRLKKYQPTMIVAPASVLRMLAVSPSLTGLQPSKVISVAEVLDSQTQQLLQKRFAKVEQIYQATEGFIACSCAHGNLHLNEEYLYIEKHWLDDKRFIPIITDFSRHTQPIVRYRLDDVLVADHKVCSCGSVTQLIEKIEGRQGDILMLPKIDGGSVPIFADVCERVFAQILPLECDYQLDQLNANTLNLQLETSHKLLDCQQAFIRAFKTLGVDTQVLIWQLKAGKVERSLTDKRRRIRNVFKGGTSII